MTYHEAREKIKIAPARTDKPAKLNPSLTQAQAVEIVSAAIEEGVAKGRGDQELDHLMEKRVYQVCLNQCRPRIPA